MIRLIQSCSGKERLEIRHGIERERELCVCRHLLCDDQGSGRVDPRRNRILVRLSREDRTARARWSLFFFSHLSFILLGWLLTLAFMIIFLVRIVYEHFSFTSKWRFNTCHDKLLLCVDWWLPSRKIGAPPPNSPQSQLPHNRRNSVAARRSKQDGGGGCCVWGAHVGR